MHTMYDRGGWDAFMDSLRQKPECNRPEDIASMSQKINSLYNEVNEKDKSIRHIQETVMQQQETIRRSRDKIESLSIENARLVKEVESYRAGMCASETEGLCNDNAAHIRHGY